VHDVTDDWIARTDGTGLCSAASWPLCAVIASKPACLPVVGR